MEVLLRGCDRIFKNVQHQVRLLPRHHKRGVYDQDVGVVPHDHAILETPVTDPVADAQFRVELPSRGGVVDEIGGPMEGLRALGVQSQPQLEAIYRAGVDVMALPCRHAPDGDRDGVPVALMEAMARGVPVVSTAVGGIGELVEDGSTGMLVPPDDTLALREALARLASSADLRQHLGCAGREHVRATRQPGPRSLDLRKVLLGSTKSEI